jgi:hypothetical protein
MTCIGSQRGVAFVAVLAVIGVMLAVSVAAARLRNATYTAERVEQVRDELLQQAGTIRTKLIACVVNWPAGDNGSGWRAPYPAGAASSAVSALQCPGAPVALQPLWNGSDGVLPPRAMPDFGTWSYANDGTSMRIWITAADHHTATTAAMNSAALRLGTAASISGSTLTIELSK